MSLAWSSSVLLLLLLPGVLFLFGLFLPEKFTRETVERSALTQLSAVLCVSLAVHVLLIALNRAVVSVFPEAARIDFRALIVTVTLDGRDGQSIGEVAAMIETYWLPIMAHLTLSSALGLCCGFLVAKHLAPRIGGFAPHPWVFDLSVGDNFTLAYVLTHIKQDDRILLYRGWLKSFALKKDGTFSYVVLTAVKRSYMVLSEDSPRTKPRQDWRTIGTAPGSIEHAADDINGRKHTRSYLCIEGEDIANVYFDRYEIDSADFSIKEFDKIVAAAVKRIQETSTANSMSADSAENATPQTPPVRESSPRRKARSPRNEGRDNT